MLVETIALAFVVLILVVAGMAVGVIFSGRRITGSCGGLSALQGIEQCGVCGRDLSDNPQSDCGKQGAGLDRLSAHK
jgi:hypothetical protein